MAAGRIDVSRRHESYRHSKRDFECLRSCAHDVGFSRVTVCKNGYLDSSSVHGRDCKRTGFSCRDEERELGEFWAGNLGDSCAMVEDGAKASYQDGIQLPLEKKRKFSPILSDIEDKEVSVSTKDGVISRSMTLSGPPSPASDQRSDLTSDRNIKDDLVSVSQIDDHELESDRGSPEEENGGNGWVQGQGGNEFAEVRNISMSRWACYNDSPVSSGEDMSGKSLYRKSSISESGDFLIEALDGQVTKLSGHNERDECSDEDFESDDLMVVDRICDEDSEGDRIECIGDSCGIEELEDATHRTVNMLECCRSVFEYERLDEISEGTYGKVYRARDKKTGEIVALKKVKMAVGKDRNLEEYGFPLTALREINILLSFHHPSIVNVKEVVMGDLDSVFMVMEYMEHDLKGMMGMMKQPFSTSEVKCLMLQLLEGIKHLHDNWVLHRDLKTSNLLINNQGELKICDFGMSRLYGSPLKPYTSLVVTMWYRAPELLLGAKEYSIAVDMWSVGCIMAELLSKEPLFRGRNEIDQLDKIFRTLGTPNEMIWPEFSKLPGAKANFVRQPHNTLRKKFPATCFMGSPALSSSGFDLLNSLLTYDPNKRITADAALNHPWFHEVPLPKSKELMPTFPPQNAKKR